MRYLLSANEPERERTWTRRLREHGYDVTEEYGDDVVVVTLGGDGSILYAAREFPDPKILPVRTGDSVGYRTTVDADGLLGALERLERDGAETVVEHPKIAAYRDGRQLRGGFEALNDINLHHASPVRAAIFTVRVHDRGETRVFERCIGDGVVVATPFGSTGYYRAIGDGLFTAGLGVAFNNVHSPADTPGHVGLSEDARIELVSAGNSRSSGAVLGRDDADDSVELSDEAVEIRRTERTVGVLHPPEPD